MPGPKMGPRPADFNENLVKQSPTFHKWLKLEPGEKLRYACRDFIRGHENDEERLMRRIMIARRNNLRDHAILKKARRITDSDGNASDATPVIAKVVEEQAAPAPAPAARKRRPASTFTDRQVMEEMDVPAVEATRSYRAWSAMEDGQVFIYNQKYVKGQADHDWLLRKNIWRRMRYRRENKKMVKELTKLAEDDPTLIVPTNNKTNTNGRQQPPPQKSESPNESELPPTVTAAQAPETTQQQPTASEIVDQALSPLEATNQVAHTPAIDNDADALPPLRGMATTETPPVETGAGAKREASDAVADANMKPTKVAKMEVPDMSVAASNTVNPLDIEVGNPLPSAETPPGILPDNGVVHQQEPDLESTINHHHHHHAELPPQASNEHHPQHHPDDDAALTAAAAATASGAADDLVELSAVEAAVAAAASYAQYQNQAHGDEDDEDDDDENMQSVVHNPLEAAANAAALDSAAKLAAAAAQPGNDTEHDEAMQVVLDTEDMLMSEEPLTNQAVV